MTDSAGMWAIVEVMGYRVRAGLCSDAQIAGAVFLRIEHPTKTDAGGDEPATEYYAPTSIFAVRPCSKEEAESCASMHPWPTQFGTITPRALGAADDDDTFYIDEAKCRVCGCTDDNAQWVETDLCSECAP